MTDPNAATLHELDRFFAKVVLCLGGVFATHECPDELVWKVTKSLERIYLATRTGLLEDEPPEATDAHRRRREPHPAIADLLTRIGP